MAKKKGFIRSNFQFSRWMGMQEIKSNASNIRTLFNELTKYDQSEFSETFEEAIKRLNLSEQDIATRTIYFLRLSMLYLFFALCLVAYSIYLYYVGDLIGTLMCLPIISVLLSFCFKEHFWYTQMKHRRLGMNFRNWLDCLLKGEVR